MAPEHIVVPFVANNSLSTPALQDARDALGSGHMPPWPFEVEHIPKRIDRSYQSSLIMTHRDRVSSPLGRSECEGDADPSSSVRDAPSGLETRPAGRPFGASGRRPAPLMMLQHHLATHSYPEDPTGRHDESLSVSFGCLIPVRGSSSP